MPTCLVDRTGKPLLAVSQVQGLQHGPELGPRLGQFGLRVGSLHDAGAGVEAHPVRIFQDGSAQSDAPLAIAGSVQPAHGPGIGPAVHFLQLQDEPPGILARRPAHRRSGVQGLNKGQGGGQVAI